MFGALYLRKPPGFSWSVAIASLVFGETEFAARSVGAASGVIMVLATWWFATRWFGSPWGLVAGVAQLTTPLFWRFARSAEIDGLNNALTQIAVYLTIDLVVQSPGRPRRTVMLASVGLGVMIALAFAVKGPAGMPCVLGALLAAALVQRDWRWLVSKRVRLAAGVASLPVAGLVLLLAVAVARSSEAPILEHSTDFDWRAKQWLGVLLLAPQAILQAVPAGFLLVVPIAIHSRGTREDRIARAVALATAIALAVYVLVGVHNPRYAMPAMTFVPVLAGYAGPRAWRYVQNRGWRSRLRVVGGIYAATAAAAWLVLVYVVEPRAGSTSGRRIAARFAEVVPDGATVWADGLIEARPETLMYARRLAAKEGRHWEVLWKKTDVASAVLPPSGGYLALRKDDGETARYRDAGAMDRLETLLEGTVHRYSFTLFRVRATPDHALTKGDSAVAGLGPSRLSLAPP